MGIPRSKGCERQGWFLECLLADCLSEKTRKMEEPKVFKGRVNPAIVVIAKALS